MSFGSRLSQARKQKNLSQKQLAEAVDSLAVTIGRYERDEVKPSIEVAAALAVELEVSLDWLAGLHDEPLEPSTAKRILDLQKLPEQDREHIFYTLDNLIKAAKFKAIQ